MKRLILVVASALLWAAVVPLALCAEETVWEDIAQGNTQVSAVLVSEDKPRMIYCGSPMGVFKRQDGRLQWERVLAIASGRQRVNSLVFGAHTEDSVYAACSNGLFRTADAGVSWQKVFEPSSRSVSGCTAVAESGTTVFAGTGSGLYYSRDGCRHWTKVQGKPGNDRVSALAVHPQKEHTLLCATESGVWYTEDSGSSWRKIFLGGCSQEDGQEEREEEEAEAKEREATCDADSVSAVAFDPCLEEKIYLGTGNGIIVSDNNGSNWAGLAQHGLVDRAVRSVYVADNSRIFALAGKRIYEYSQQRWKDVSARLACGSVNAFALDRSRTLYAACDQGLFMTKLSHPEEPSSTRLQLPTTPSEPTVNQVQQAAIRYAEVEPEKILLWRRQATHKAWLPELSFGLNNDISDFRHWEGGSTTRESDDQLRKGKQSMEWDVALKWDLGELIWNEDQTSIDVRSRLLVELRNDILDQVTKLYFERMKVKAELDGLATADETKRKEKEMRLMELTAYLDGLTGGYFSQTAGKKE